MDLSMISLIIVNMIPLIGVFMGWSLLPILLFYWLESFVIGIYNLIKMIITLGKGSNITQIILIPFFMFHYGGFMAGHLIFVIVISSMQYIANGVTFSTVMSDLLWLIIPTIFLFISHGISLKQNFLGNKEYEKTTVGELMMAPYQRIVVMHLTLLLGSFVMVATGAPLFLITLFILLKIVIDLKAHRKSHSL